MIASYFSRRFEINSIRGRMISGFVLLLVLMVTISAISTYTLSKTSKIANIHSHIGQLQIYTLSLFKNDNDFFDLGATGADYFATHASIYLAQRDSLLKAIHTEIQQVTSLNQQVDSNVLTEKLAAIRELIDQYNSKFITLDSLLFTRGFKDYGLEGLMRIHAHKLEGDESRVFIGDLLYLRRHEKDFFLRLDTAYVTLFSKRTDKITREISRQAYANRFDLFHLEEYSRIFHQLVSIHKSIGMSGNDGIRNDLNNLTFSISNTFLTLSEYSYQLSSEAKESAGIVFTLVIIAAICFSVTSILWVLKRLIIPISALSRHMEKTHGADRTRRIKLSLPAAAEEIQILIASYNNLVEKNEAQVKEISDKGKLLEKSNEELKQVNNELDRFLYSTAHDLRSPLTSLLGLHNLLRYEKEKENLERYLSMMKESILRLDTFIGQIVTYYHNKKVDLHYESVDIEKIIIDVLDAHRFTDPSNTIHWRLDIRQSIPIYSDRLRLTTLFNNLVSNCIKYSDLSKPNPTVRLKLTVDSNHFIIQVKDNGIGISEEHLRRIFDMFYRANEAARGSGLGLYIFKETLNKLGGMVAVESKLGTGTIFTITIPNRLTAGESSATPVVSMASA